MEPQQFSVFRHEAVHELMHLNDLCEAEFRISSCPRWDYDLDRGILIFSDNGAPKIVARIQVVGTTSATAGTWMWAWANDSLPESVTREMARLQEFGHVNGIRELTTAELPDDEYLGWGMTAVAARLLAAKGAYRCPRGDGFIYLLYSSVEVASGDDHESKSKQVECADHGFGLAAFVCEHLLSNPAQEWFSRERDEENKWPDAWCAACDRHFQEQDEWNEKNESKIKIKVICHRCYEGLRAEGTFGRNEN